MRTAGEQLWLSMCRKNKGISFPMALKTLPKTCNMHSLSDGYHLRILARSTWPLSHQESPDESSTPHNVHWNWLSKGRIINKHTTLIRLWQFPWVSAREAYNEKFCQSCWKKQEADACGVWRPERELSKAGALVFCCSKGRICSLRKMSSWGSHTQRREGQVCACPSETKDSTNFPSL